MSRSPSSRHAPSNQTRSIACKRIGIRQHSPRRVRCSNCWLYALHPLAASGRALAGTLMLGSRRRRNMSQLKIGISVRGARAA